jgi:hypothetical protein
MSAETEAEWRQRIESKIDLLLTAFPNGIAAHIAFHAEQTDAAETTKRMKLAAIEQVIKGSVWALLLAALTGLWQYGKEHLTK